MRYRLLVAAWTWWIGLPLVAVGQFQQGDSKGARLGEAQTQKWQAGVVVTADSGPCTGIVAYVPMPIDWPEQQITIIEEDFSPTAKVSYETIDESVKLMIVRMPMLPAGYESHALVTFEVKRSALLPPEDTGIYVLPNPRKMDRRVRNYLGPSPYIESRSPKIRSLAKELEQEKDTEAEKAWERVEAIYDRVREKVEYKNGLLKGALAALNDGTGDCEEMTSLFIAVCRASDIPARTVWVPGHCYPEFYLEDEEGKGHWFPCQAAGSRDFGGILEYRPVLQKGDNFRPPYDRSERQRYLAEHLTGTGGKPTVKFVRKTL
ncbi:MAG: transglutaminase domain-containing protein [Rhodopirellula sp.]|nr:transglutaminase domain-containing protein [Rhodopirellula sp.]